MSKVLIVDDHTAFRKGLNLMIQEIPEVKEVVELVDGEQFLNTIDKILPDVIFMDIRLPGISGMDAAVLALKQNPQLRIIFLTMFGEEKYYRDAMNAGAKGFILKPPTLLQLKDAYQTVMQGRVYFPTELKLW